jgi:hypothetical protein
MSGQQRDGNLKFRPCNSGAKPECTLGCVVAVGNP